MIKTIFFLMIFNLPFAYADGEYIKHDATLLTLQGKINADEKAIRELLIEKNNAPTTEKSHEAVKEIKDLLKSRKENINKFNKEFHHIRFEHPEKDGKFDTKYRRYDNKSVKEFEDEVDKSLSNVYQNMKNKYNQENN